MIFLPRPPSLPEIQHRITQRAAHEPTSIQGCIEQAFLSQDFAPDVAHRRAQGMQNQVVTHFDEELRTFRARRMKEFCKRQPGAPDMAVPLAEAGSFRWTPQVRARILALEDPKDLELLIGNLLIQRECDEVVVGRGAQDGGVDFVGRRSLDADDPPDPEALTGPSLLADMNVYIFGQAKRHALHRIVGPAVAERLVGSMVHVRGGGTPVYDRLKTSLTDWGWEPADPIILALATSGSFSRPMVGLATKYRYRLFDGEQLAQRVIQLSPGIESEDQLDDLLAGLTNEPLDGVEILP